MVQEGAISDWFEKAFGSISNKKLTVDWVKAEQYLGSPIPDEVKYKVEEYLGSKTFMVYKYSALAIAIGSIGTIGAFLMAFIGGSGEAAFGLGRGVCIMCFELCIWQFFVHGKFNRSVIDEFKSRIVDADPSTRKAIAKNYERKAWGAIMDNLKVTDKDGEHPTLSGFMWMLIILYILGIFLTIAGFGA